MKKRDELAERRQRNAPPPPRPAPPLRAEHVAFLQALVDRMVAAGFERGRILDEEVGRDRIFGVAGAWAGKELEATFAARTYDMMALGLNQLANMVDQTLAAGGAEGMTCGKCGLHYQTAEQAAKGIRCRCWQHCPCRGLCRVGCPCEPIADRRRR